MKRDSLASSIALLALSLAAAANAGCAAESTPVQGGDEQDSDNVVLVGIDPGSDAEEPSFDEDGHVISHVEQHHAARCQGCGPVPDPWKSIAGPVPDPWDPDPPADPPASDGSTGHGKRKH